MRKFYLFCVICFISVLISCQKDDSIAINNESSSITVNSISKCKNNLLAQIAVVLDKEGVEYSYDKVNKVLHLTHVNADFSCDMSEFEANENISEGIIAIREREVFNGSPSKCNCVFDIQYSIYNVECSVYTCKVPGMEDFIVESAVYTLRVPGLKDFIVDLANNPTGSYYEPRDTYPWKTE
jgi:hypothetical protein